MDFLRISEPVAQALQENKPVVALESTIISHGMPYPDNIQMALNVEQIVSQEGAVPATVAILDGKICVGLSQEEIERLGSQPNVVKTGIRDLPRVLATKQMGGTTVATTSYAAHTAGIRFFATGGLGGVHRGVNETYDISNDLASLARHKVCVISAGVKLILDVPKTLEYLETLGVPVYGFETDRYPGFYIRNSGQPVEAIDLQGLVDLLRVQDQLDLNYAVNVGVPIPQEDELDPELVEKTIAEAVQESERLGISGKDVTPFLLDRLKEQTGGKSLQANIALMENNARTAAQIARVYHEQ